MLSEEKEQILKTVFCLSKRLGKVPFPLIIKLSTGFDLIPIDMADKTDNELIEILNKILKRFLKTSAFTHTRYEDGRINEVGRRIEQGLEPISKLSFYRL